jgi:hypothetical protein
LWRNETRRKAREGRAAEMIPETPDPIAWYDIAPHLDQALDKID